MMSTMTAEFEVAICGAGPVGLALALMLAKRGINPLKIALIDAKPVQHSAQDPRSIALSFGSRQLLEGINAWPAIYNPIHQIHISRQSYFGRTMIDRDEYGLPALGYVTRYGLLADELATKVAQSEIVCFRPVAVDSCSELNDRVEVFLSDGRTLSSELVVQAEGGVFNEQSIKALTRQYQQIAIIAQVKVDAPLPCRAFERFTDEGPLALLPQDDGYALVWCVSPWSAERIKALSDSAFLLELQKAFGHRLGRFIGTGKRQTYPLGLNAGATRSLRTVSIGNAAQTLHPVAGQGLNLGLRDAAVLAKLVAQERSPAMLERFASCRHEDRSLTIRLTDIMARIFSSPANGIPLQSILGLMLGVMDIFPPAKHLLSEQMIFGRR